MYFFFFSFWIILRCFLKPVHVPVSVHRFQDKSVPVLCWGFVPPFLAITPRRTCAPSSAPLSRFSETVSRKSPTFKSSHSSVCSKSWLSRGQVGHLIPGEGGGRRRRKELRGRKTREHEQRLEFFTLQNITLYHIISHYVTFSRHFYPPEEIQ